MHYTMNTIPSFEAKTKASNMSSISSPHKLPIIDLSKQDLKPGSITWEKVRDDVLEALMEYGCFEAIYDNKISKELHDQVFKGLADLFDLPSETKCRLKDPLTIYDGYLPNLPITPFFERFGIPAKSDAIHKLTHLMWPHGNTQFSEALCSFAEGLQSLESIITRMVFEGLGVEKYLDPHIKLAGQSLRLMRYNAPMTDDEEKVGVISHYDVNFITILQQNCVSGLEVKLKDETWIKVNPSSSSFVVIIGESFRGWSNGRLQCPRHRVMISGNKARYSIGCFSYIKGTIIQIPKELVDDQHPLLYKPFDEAGLTRIFQTVDLENLEFGSGLDTYYKM